ncbi:MAG: glycosyltransferase family 9 protein [bacterium]
MIAGGRTLTRIGLLRNDALGDTLLTLPVAAAVKRYDPAVEVELICDPGFRALMAAHPDLDRVVGDEGGTAGRFARQLRDRDYDAILVLRPTPRNAWAAFRAGIPARAGTAFRFYGMLFNVRWYGHRKGNQRHEAEYNMELLERLLGQDMGHPQFYLPPPPEAEASVETLLEEEGVARGRPLAALHPGSRGSALAWPAEHFAELARMLRAEEVQVVVTGVGEEADLTARVSGAAPGIVDLTGRTSLEQLAWLYKRCDTMVANSTGTLHLAAAVGTKVVGLYPAAEINSPKRWGPFGPGHKVFRGPVDNCPECVGEECPVYNCLEMVRPEEVLRVTLGLIAQSPLRSRREAEST